MAKQRDRLNRDAGVDIERGNAFVRPIKPYARATHRPGVVGGICGFGALFSLAGLNYRNPLLVSSTDGVGTKLKLAIDLNRHRTIGIDLVAMCANDVVVQGAEPLFFLDYFVTGRLNLDTAEQVVAGIARGRELAGDGAHRRRDGRDAGLVSNSGLRSGRNLYRRSITYATAASPLGESVGWKQRGRAMRAWSSMPASAQRL